MTSVRMPRGTVCGARPFLRLTYCLLSLTLLAGIARAATSYPALFIYGDSFSDSNGVLGTWKAYRGPASPPNSRVWSNGPTWPYYLAQSMGLNCPYGNFNTDAGVVCPVWRNYATGGACSKNWGLSPGTAPVCTDIGVPSTYFYPYQVQTHNDASINATLNREGLHIVGIGSNDMMMFEATGLASAVSKASETREAIKLGVEALYNGGARHFFLINLESVLLCPEVLGFSRAKREVFDEFVQQYAEDYHSNVVVPLRARLTEATITEINLLGCFNKMSANCTFRQLGFTNWEDPCIQDPNNPSSSKCSDPSKYIWWDDVHHTTAFHQVLAWLFQDVIDGKANACLQTACLGDSPLDSCPGGLDICESGNAAAPGGVSMWAMVGAVLVAVLSLGLSF
eukprot:jgi/Mesvir1/10089/Mv11249-RA.1